MDERDRDNLRFLMNLKTENIMQWMLEVGPDDVMYAMALLETAALEELDIETEENELAEANSLLAQFMLPKNNTGSLPAND